MDLKNAQMGYLRLRLKSAGDVELELDENFDEIINSWNSSTRVSPIFWYTETSEGAEFPVQLKKFILFAGPIYPPKLFQHVPLSEDTDFYLTYGIYNCIVTTNDELLLEQIEGFLASNNVAYERWKANSGYYPTSNIIQSLVHGVETSSINELLSGLYRRSVGDEVSVELSEFTALAASAINRASIYREDIFASLTKLIKMVEAEVLSGLAENSVESVNNYLTKANAALSRFASQTFSGTFPIPHTECHFWCHSLLGTGLANYGLFNFVSEIDSVLTENSLSSKLIAAAKLTGKNAPDLTRKENSKIPFWEETSSQLTLKTSESSHLTTLPYYSGRDGFLSEHNFISAPLKTINKCANEKWSLLTLTHELCHIAMKGPLSMLLPIKDFDIDEFEYGYDDAWELIEQQGKNNDLLSRIREVFLKSIVGYHQKTPSKSIGKGKERYQYASVNTIEELIDIIEYESKDIEEILVHILDYLIFYAGDEKRYIRGIWSTWAVVPDAFNKIEEYLIRTVSALISAKLASHSKNSFEDIKAILNRELASLKDDDFGYIDEAKKNN